MTLVPVDPKNETSVITLLERAGQWLAEAVHRGEAGDIAAVKAQIATAAEATRQLNLSKEIQLDAQEMVRRAEYALGKAIRRGQAEGTIRTVGVTATRYGGRAGRGRGEFDPDVQHTDNSVGRSPTEFATMNELSGPNGNGIYALAEAEPDEFEEALGEAKEEGNPSRANVVRKIKKQAPGPVTRDQRAALIEELAAQGYSSRQMPSRVGVTEESVRLIARDYGIEIPADRSIGRSRRINSTDVVVNTATALEGLIAGIELIEYADVDPLVASQWADSLSDSLKKLSRFVKQIKETTHD